jgi:hypothetical protein
LPGVGLARYRGAVDRFDLDMAFAPADVAAGLERLCHKRGIAWSCSSTVPEHYQLTLTLHDTAAVQIEIRPLPAHRMTYVGAFPRTLLEARAAAGVDLEALRRDIVLAFMRVTG